MRVALAALLVVAGTLPALAQTKTYEIQKPSGTWQQPGPIQQPKGTWQVPGEIQVPKEYLAGPAAGEIQVPKGIQALRATSSRLRAAAERGRRCAVRL